jgi:hypothetical protein
MASMIFESKCWRGCPSHQWFFVAIAHLAPAVSHDATVSANSL